MKNQAPAPLLLASASPRRREILTLLGEDFEVVKACCSRRNGLEQGSPKAFCKRKMYQFEKEEVDCWNQYQS